MTASMWDAASAMMDDKVDEIVGDRILYAANGVSFVEVPGFVLTATEGLSMNVIDEIMDVRRRIKIAKAQIPYPDPEHRLRHARLGAGTFRPAGALPEDDGRYWLFDVEKA